MTNKLSVKNRKNKGWANIQPGHGRNKGSKNKFTTLKQAFLDAFEKLGGYQGLYKWAEKNDRTKAHFYQMIAKMLPSNIDIEAGEKLQALINRIITDKRPQE